MCGNLSGKTASQLWFCLQLQLEEARYSGRGVVGAVADLEKAFNLLPRPPLMAAARAVGIPEPALVDLALHSHVTRVCPSAEVSTIGSFKLSKSQR